jgi:hypothetical protein
VSYSWIWENLSIAGKAAGIGHLKLSCVPQCIPDLA